MDLDSLDILGEINRDPVGQHFVSISHSSCECFSTATQKEQQSNCTASLVQKIPVPGLTRFLTHIVSSLSNWQHSINASLENVLTPQSYIYGVHINVLWMWLHVLEDNKFFFFSPWHRLLLDQFILYIPSCTLFSTGYLQPYIYHSLFLHQATLHIPKHNLNLLLLYIYPIIATRNHIPISNINLLQFLNRPKDIF